MKFFIPLLVLLFFSVCVSAQVEKIIPQKPNPPKLVNDYTNTLKPEEVQALENKLVAYNDSTSNQIAVVIIKTIGNYSDEQVALGILRNWGVGNKDKNNGIVVLVVKDDKKIRIEVGYGLEGAVPDVTSKSIIDNDLTPNFKEGNYYRGLDEATNSIMKASAGEYKVSEANGSRKGIWFGIIFFILLIGFAIFASIKGRGHGGGGLMAGLLLGSMMGGGGHRGGWSGGGGGGFGGFGGGMGGGGGASGGW